MCVLRTTQPTRTHPVTAVAGHADSSEVRRCTRQETTPERIVEPSSETMTPAMAGAMPAGNHMFRAERTTLAPATHRVYGARMATFPTVGRPPGCKTTNGNTFTRLAKPAGQNWAYIEFHDGKVYRVSPVTDRDFATIPTRSNQPGCWFNHDLSKRPDYQYRRMPRWPRIPSAGWLSIFL